MTTFQAIVYGIIQGFAQILPVSAAAHQKLTAALLGWPEPGPALMGTLAASAALAILIYFRHDWLSMFSCFLQVLIYRKKPMTLDERLPLFIALAGVPVGLTAYYFHSRSAGAPWHFGADLNWTPWILAIALAAFALPLWLSDSLSRRNKGMFDWNWRDVLVIGIFQATAFIPGSGSTDGALMGAFFRNYNREAATKFAFYVTMPLLASMAIADLKSIDLHAATPAPEMSWLTLGVSFIVATLTSLLAIGGFMKHVQRRGMGQYVAYRFIAALVVAAAFWFKNRS